MDRPEHGPDRFCSTTFFEREITMNLTRPLATAILAAALSLSATAHAASTRSPAAFDPPRDIGPNHSIEVGDPFLPRVDNGPKPSPQAPPKLHCTFTIIDNVVTITWTNVGGTAVGVGTVITGTTSGGIGMSVHLVDPIEAGGVFVVSHAWDPFDPAWFGDDCVAKIKAV
jgi:hypothetical protein